MGEAVHNTQELGLDELISLSVQNISTVLESMRSDSRLGTDLADAITAGRHDAAVVAAASDPGEKLEEKLEGAPYTILPALREFAKYAAIIEAEKGEQA